MVLVLGFVFIEVVWPRLTRVVLPEAGSEAISGMDSDADLTLDLPGGPIGVAWNGNEFVVGNRNDPWGFLRLTPSGSDGFEVAKVPVTEPNYRQQVGFDAVTWNGTHYVGYTSGDWFQSPENNVFTLHDPVSLRFIRYEPAPELLGCLAWNGDGYWAATRRNTENADEEAYLYRLDESFQVVDRMEPPGVGCQGLAWDGS